MLERIVVLGFDARSSLNGPSGWTNERRSQFLIRTDILQPASVDRAVWPALSTRSNPEHPLDLWISFSRLLAIFPQLARDAGVSPVAIEISVIADEQAFDYWENTFFGQARPQDDNRLKLTAEELGYDIADRYLVSGLSNCMLSPHELADIRRTWSEQINLFGLFSSTANAAAFRQVCDRLIPEHAPFFVYRIRKIKPDDISEKGPVNQGDINLGTAAFNIGASLKNGTIKPSDIGQKIGELCAQ